MDKKFMAAEPDARRVADQQFLHTEQAGAFVPLLQAVITGFMLGLAVFAILTVFRVRDAWLYGLLVWLLAQAFTWLLLATHWFSLTNLEKLTGRDINRDGAIGAPTRQPGGETTVKIEMREISSSGHLSVTVARFPISDAQLAMIATALVGGAPFSERFWVGTGKPLSQKQFRLMREEMITRGMLELANPKDERQGYKLTKPGMAVMRDYAKRYGEAPAPLGEDA